MRNREELYLDDESFWATIDEDVRVPRLELERWLVNRGKLFYAYSLVRSSDAPRLEYIVVGAKSLHLRIAFKAGLETPVDLIEGVTVSEAGTLLPHFNYNREYSDNGLLSRFYVGGSVTGGSTIRENIAGFGSAPGHATSGEVAGATFYGLKPNATYALNQIPSASTSTYILFEAYEVKG